MSRIKLSASGEDAWSYHTTASTVHYDDAGRDPGAEAQVQEHPAVYWHTGAAAKFLVVSVAAGATFCMPISSTGSALVASMVAKTDTRPHIRELKQLGRNPLRADVISAAQIAETVARLKFNVLTADPVVEAPKLEMMAISTDAPAHVVQETAEMTKREVLLTLSASAASLIVLASVLLALFNVLYWPVWIPAGIAALGLVLANGLQIARLRKGSGHIPAVRQL